MNQKSCQDSSAPGSGLDDEDSMKSWPPSFGGHLYRLDLYEMNLASQTAPKRARRCNPFVIDKLGVLKSVRGARIDTVSPSILSA